MLALSSSISTTRDDHRSSAAVAAAMEFADIIPEDLPGFTAADDEVKSLDLLEGIDYFDDLLIGIGNGDVLPDLEVDPEILGEYSGGSESNTSPALAEESGGCKPAVSGKEEESKGGQPVKTVRRRKKGKNTGKKSSYSQGKSKDSGKSDNNSDVKKKAKVDWTPELHRRFVQAVEQLGVDKAVPSRILELMGVHSLTRHNVASHLQKYRSHRKHLLAREAEAASWNLRRQATAAAAVAVTAGGNKPWMAPTLGYPPMTAHLHHFRPLHVWGHPTWPKHKPKQSSSPPPPPPPPPVLVPPSWPLTVATPPPNPIYWHQSPVYPQPIVSPWGYGAPPVPGIPSSNHTIYKSDTGIGVPIEQSDTHNLPTNIYPSKESMDAAIGDVMSKPWLPLPLGLKPPSLDGVMTELKRQGISKVPPLLPL